MRLTLKLSPSSSTVNVPHGRRSNLGELSVFVSDTSRTPQIVRSGLSFTVDRAADFFASGFAGVKHRNACVNFHMRTRNDMRADDFANFATGSGAGINCGFHGANFATHDTRHQTSVDLFPAN